MAISPSPIQIFKSAYDRAENFLVRGKKGGPKDKDDLRAAVVFAVAAIDTFFRFKTVEHIKRQRAKNIVGFRLPFAAQKLIRDVVAKENFEREYKDLKDANKELVDALLATNKLSLLKYLEAALKHQSFQSIEQISEGLKIMDKTPSEIWSKFSTSRKKNKKSVKHGRPYKIKPGKKIDAETQMRRLFSRRHLIVHESDVILRGKKLVGIARKIQYTEVKKWLEHSKQAIAEINKIIS